MLMLNDEPGSVLIELSCITFRLCNRMYCGHLYYYEMCLK